MYSSNNTNESPNITSTSEPANSVGPTPQTRHLNGMGQQLNFEFDVRIPDALVTQLMQGEITGSMLITMVILYKWSNWNTGHVRRVCGSSLHFASNEAYSVRTFQEALRRLEEMGWITRQMVNGSHKWYPVTIHNYKFVDDAGKVHILNPNNIKGCGEFKTGICAEGSDETSMETSGEASMETSDRLYSLHLSSHESELKSSHQSVTTTQERRKEGTAAPFSPALEKLCASWKARTGQGFVNGDAEAAAKLVEEHGLDTVESYLKDTFSAPRTAKVAWRDFGYWAAAENFDRTRRNIDAWRRTKAKGTHAEKNPELHTGKTADGKSWTGTRCKVCDMVRTDNPDGICDSCSGNGFDVEEA